MSLRKKNTAVAAQRAAYDELMMARSVVDAMEVGDIAFIETGLIENRTITDHLFGGYSFHDSLEGLFAGYSRGMQRDELTHIDTGVVQITGDLMTFVGPRQTRAWPFTHIVGYWYDNSCLYVGTQGNHTTSSLWCSPNLVAGFWARYMRFYGYDTLVRQEQQARRTEAVAMAERYNASATL